MSQIPGRRPYLCAYSSSTLLSPVTVLDSCFQRAALSPTSNAPFISTTDDSISTATSSSGWDKEPCRTQDIILSHMSGCQKAKIKDTTFPWCFASIMLCISIWSGTSWKYGKSLRTRCYLVWSVKPPTVKCIILSHHKIWILQNEKILATRTNTS